MSRLKIHQKDNGLTLSVPEQYVVCRADGSIDIDASVSAFSPAFADCVKEYEHSLNKTHKSGSRTAKSGFESENSIVEAVPNWTTDADGGAVVAQLCDCLGIAYSDVEDVQCFLWKNFPLLSEDEKRNKHKTDVFIQLKLRNEIVYRTYSISMKKFEADKANLNQLDRRWVDSYAKVVPMSAEVARLFKLFTGELLPSEYAAAPSSLKDERRLFLNEMTKEDQAVLVEWATNAIPDLVRFGFTGASSTATQPYPPEFLLVEKVSDTGVDYRLLPIEEVIELYRGNGKATISDEGSLYLGGPDFRIQRKGGDNGAKTAKNLQLKIRPSLVFSSNA